MASKEANKFLDGNSLPMQKFLQTKADKIMGKKINPVIGDLLNSDTKMSEMSRNMSQVMVDEYADAKLIEEMMDMDIGEYTRLRKLKREEDRELRKKEGQKKEETERKEKNEENETDKEKSKGEVCKQDISHDDKEDSADSEDDKSEDSEFLENITSEFFEAVKYLFQTNIHILNNSNHFRIKMKKGELYMDDMNAAFKRFLFTRYIILFIYIQTH